MSKNGSRGSKFARAVLLRETETQLQAGMHNRKARRLLAMALRRAKKEPQK